MPASNQPLYKEVPLKRLGLFSRRPSARPDISLVLFKPGSRHVALRPGDQMTIGEATFAGYKMAYEVDMSAVHPVKFSCALPSSNPAYQFEATVEAYAQVDDPAAIVSNRVQSAASTLEPLMVKVLRATAKGYDIQDVSQAEPALNEALEKEKYKIGLKISHAVVQLELDPEAAEYLRNLVRAEQDAGLEIKKTQWQVQVEEEKKALEEALREKDKEAERHELEKMQIRMTFFSPLVQQGQWELLAFQLAQDPHAIESVAASLHQAQQQEVENQIEALRLLLAGDAIEGWQLEEPTRKVLKQFVDAFTGRSGLSMLESGDASGEGDPEDGEKEE